MKLQTLSAGVFAYKYSCRAFMNHTGSTQWIFADQYKKRLKPLNDSIKLQELMDLLKERIASMVCNPNGHLDTSLAVEMANVAAKMMTLAFGLHEIGKIIHQPCRECQAHFFPVISAQSSALEDYLMRNI